DAVLVRLPDQGEAGAFGDVPARRVVAGGADLQPVPAEPAVRARRERVRDDELDGLADDAAAARVRVGPVADLAAGGAHRVVQPEDGDVREQPVVARVGDRPGDLLAERL